jgi:hypothetical protein
MGNCQCSERGRFIYFGKYAVYTNRAVSDRRIVCQSAVCRRKEAVLFYGESGSGLVATRLVLLSRVSSSLVRVRLGTLRYVWLGHV